MDTMPPPNTPEIKNNISREYSQNLQHHLWDRESGLNRRNYRGQPPPRYFLYEREFYRSVTPKLTIQNVDKPLGYMRKFTPDGQLLLCFSQDMRSLEVYTYRGVGRVAELLQRRTDECITAADHSLESLHIRQQVYERLLTFRWSIHLLPNMPPRSHLNREFSIFLEDGRYVLVASAVMSTEEPPFNYYLEYPDLYDDCEIIDTTFFLVDMRTGSVSDKLRYCHDNIAIGHHNGVAVYGNTIAILSKFRQCIDLIELVNGKLTRLYTIGPFSCSIDESHFNSLRVEPSNQSEYGKYEGNLPLSFLKQSVMSFLYREIESIECEQQRKLKLKTFYKHYKIFESMIIVKIQLIDADHLLIRYEKHPSQLPIYNTRVNMENNYDFKLYVFYCIRTKKILKCYEKNSLELLYMLRDYCDTFRNVRSQQTQRPSSSPSNNVHFHAAFNNMVNSIPGGETEAAMNYNPTVPISVQSFTTSPYLDCSLFSYDDRLISALERPKVSSIQPIRFSDRNTNITKFHLFLEAPSDTITTADGSSISSASTELVAFIYHPFDPFIISIQRLTTRYVVNFHIYNGSTVVKE